MVERPPGEIFASAPHKDIVKAMAHFQPMKASAAEVLMEEGSADPAMIVILDGRLEVWRDGVTIDTSGPGEILGEMSLFTGKPRVASVRASEDCDLLVLDLEGYEALREANNPIAHAVERFALKTLSERLRRLDELVSERAEGEASPYRKPPPSMFDRIRSFFGAETAPAVLFRPLDPLFVLQNSPLFQGERDLYLKVIASYLTQETYPAGHFLCTQGEKGDSVYLLGEGTVDVFVVKPGEDTAPDQASRIFRLGVLEPGAAFGLTALADDRPRMASCVAREQVDVLALGRDMWNRLVTESSGAGSATRCAMIRAFSGQVDEAGSHLARAIRGELPMFKAGARMEHTGTRG